jgi:hypothetical protein
MSYKSSEELKQMERDSAVFRARLAGELLIYRSEMMNRATADAEVIAEHEEFRNRGKSDPNEELLGLAQKDYEWCMDHFERAKQGATLLVKGVSEEQLACIQVIYERDTDDRVY